MFFNNLRSGLRTASHISYLLGVLSIVLALSLSLVNFPVMAQNISGASLVASGGCSGGCNGISATFTNHGSGDMTEAVVYEVQSRVNGVWIVVDSGTLGPLASGESQTVSYNPNNVSGTYRFKAYQPAGHPGSGVLYSSACKFECVLPSPTPVTPTATPVTPTSTPVTPTFTPTFTSTPVTPTATPITPTSTPVTPTSTPVTPTFTPTFTSTPVTATPQEPTPTPQEPTNTPTFTSTPVTPTATPITPTSTPVTATPQEPTPTPQEPTSTPQEPTPTPQEPTSTPVTATPQEPTPTPQEPTSTPSNPTETPVVTTTPVTATPQEPTPTPQEPGTTPQEPTKVVTQVPPTKVPTLGVPSVVDQPSVLIPVTGGDMSPVSPLEAAQKVAFNLGLGFVGLGLVLQGLRRRF